MENLSNKTAQKQAWKHAGLKLEIKHDNRSPDRKKGGSGRADSLVRTFDSPSSSKLSTRRDGGKCDSSETNVTSSFTIPRKRSAALLLELPLTSREFQHEILPMMEKSYRFPNSGKQFSYNKARNVHNEQLLEEYQERRKELRQEGYSEKELGDSYAFLFVDSEAEVEKICREGVTVGNCSSECLGHPEMGVQLSRHADILKPNSLQTGSTGFIIIFKIMKGRVKAVFENHGGISLEPTPNFDCHVSKDSSLDGGQFTQKQLFESTQIYLYEYGDLDVEERPRHVLPVAVVHFKYKSHRPPDIGSPRVQAIVPKSPSTPNLGSRQEPWEYIVWSGVLSVKGLFTCPVQMMSTGNMGKPAKVGTGVNISHKIGLKEGREKYLRSCPILARNAETFCDGWYINICQLRPVQSKSNFEKIRNFLGKSETMAVLKVEEDVLLLMTDNEITYQLGLTKPHQYNVILHCLFLSKESMKQKKSSHQSTDFERVSTPVICHPIGHSRSCGSLTQAERIFSAKVFTEAQEQGRSSSGYGSVGQHYRSPVYRTITPIPPQVVLLPPPSHYPPATTGRMNHPVSGEGAFASSSTHEEQALGGECGRKLRGCSPLDEDASSNHSSASPRLEQISDSIVHKNKLENNDYQIGQTVKKEFDSSTGRENVEEHGTNQRQMHGMQSFPRPGETLEETVQNSSPLSPFSHGSEYNSSQHSPFQAPRLHIPLSPGFGSLPPTSPYGLPPPPPPLPPPPPPLPLPLPPPPPPPPSSTFKNPSSPLTSPPYANNFQGFDGRPPSPFLNRTPPSPLQINTPPPAVGLPFWFTTPPTGFLPSSNLVSPCHSQDPRLSRQGAALGSNQGTSAHLSQGIQDHGRPHLRRSHSVPEPEHLFPEPPRPSRVVKPPQLSETDSWGRPPQTSLLTPEKLAHFNEEPQKKKGMKTNDSHMIAEPLYENEIGTRTELRTELYSPISPASDDDTQDMDAAEYSKTDTEMEDTSDKFERLTGDNYSVADMEIDDTNKNEEDITDCGNIETLIKQEEDTNIILECVAESPNRQQTHIPEGFTPNRARHPRTHDEKSFTEKLNSFAKDFLPTSPFLKTADKESPQNIRVPRLLPRTSYNFEQVKGIPKPENKSTLLRVSEADGKDVKEIVFSTSERNFQLMEQQHEQNTSSTKQKLGQMGLHRSSLYSSSSGKEVRSNSSHHKTAIDTVSVRYSPVSDSQNSNPVPHSSSSVKMGPSSGTQKPSPDYHNSNTDSYSSRSESCGPSLASDSLSKSDTPDSTVHTPTDNTNKPGKTENSKNLAQTGNSDCVAHKPSPNSRTISGPHFLLHSESAVGRIDSENSNRTASESEPVIQSNELTSTESSQVDSQASLEVISQDISNSPRHYTDSLVDGDINKNVLLKGTKCFESVEDSIKSSDKKVSSSCKDVDSHGLKIDGQDTETEHFIAICPEVPGSTVEWMSDDTVGSGKIASYDTVDTARSPSDIPNSSHTSGKQKDESETTTICYKEIMLEVSRKRRWDQTKKQTDDSSDDSSKKVMVEYRLGTKKQRKHLKQAHREKKAHKRGRIKCSAKDKKRKAAEQVLSSLNLGISRNKVNALSRIKKKCARSARVQDSVSTSQSDSSARGTSSRQYKSNQRKYFQTETDFNSESDARSKMAEENTCCEAESQECLTISESAESYKSLSYARSTKLDQKETGASDFQAVRGYSSSHGSEINEEGTISLCKKLGENSEKQLVVPHETSSEELDLDTDKICERPCSEEANGNKQTSEGNGSSVGRQNWTDRSLQWLTINLGKQSAEINDGHVPIESPSVTELKLLEDDAERTLNSRNLQQCVNRLLSQELEENVDTCTSDVQDCPPPEDDDISKGDKSQASCYDVLKQLETGRTECLRVESWHPSKSTAATPVSEDKDVFFDSVHQTGADHNGGIPGLDSYYSGGMEQLVNEVVRHADNQQRTREERLEENVKGRKVTQTTDSFHCTIPGRRPKEQKNFKDAGIIDCLRYVLHGDCNLFSPPRHDSLTVPNTSGWAIHNPHCTKRTCSVQRNNNSFIIHVTISDSQEHVQSDETSSDKETISLAQSTVLSKDSGLSSVGVSSDCPESISSTRVNKRPETAELTSLQSPTSQKKISELIDSTNTQGFDPNECEHLKGSYTDLDNVVTEKSIMAEMTDSQLVTDENNDQILDNEPGKKPNSSGRVLTSVTEPGILTSSRQKCSVSNSSKNPSSKFSPNKLVTAVTLEMTTSGLNSVKDSLSKMWQSENDSTKDGKTAEDNPVISVKSESDFGNDQDLCQTKLHNQNNTTGSPPPTDSSRSAGSCPGTESEAVPVENNERTGDSTSSSQSSTRSPSRESEMKSSTKDQSKRVSRERSPRRKSLEIRKEMKTDLKLRRTEDGEVLERQSSGGRTDFGKRTEERKDKEKGKSQDLEAMKRKSVDRSVSIDRRSDDRTVLERKPKEAERKDRDEQKDKQRLLKKSLDGSDSRCSSTKSEDRSPVKDRKSPKKIITEAASRLRRYSERSSGTDHHLCEQKPGRHRNWSGQTNGKSSPDLTIQDKLRKLSTVSVKCDDQSIRIERRTSLERRQEEEKKLRSRSNSFERGSVDNGKSNAALKTTSGRKATKTSSSIKTSCSSSRIESNADQTSKSSSENKTEPGKITSRHARQFHPYKKQIKEAKKEVPSWSFDVAYRDLNELLQNLTTKTFQQKKREPVPVPSRKDMPKNPTGRRRWKNINCRFNSYTFARAPVQKSPKKSKSGRHSCDPEEKPIVPDVIPDFEERGRQADMLEQMYCKTEKEAIFEAEQTVYTTDKSFSSKSSKTGTRKNASSTHLPPVEIAVETEPHDKLKSSLTQLILPGGSRTSLYSATHLDDENVESREILGADSVRKMIIPEETSPQSNSKSSTERYDKTPLASGRIDKRSSSDKTPAVQSQTENSSSSVGIEAASLSQSLVDRPSTGKSKSEEVKTKQLTSLGSLQGKLLSSKGCREGYSLTPSSEKSAEQVNDERPITASKFVDKLPTKQECQKDCSQEVFSLTEVSDKPSLPVDRVQTNKKPPQVPSLELSSATLTANTVDACMELKLPDDLSENQSKKGIYDGHKSSEEILDSFEIHVIDDDFSEIDDETSNTFPIKAVAIADNTASKRTGLVKEIDVTKTAVYISSDVDSTLEDTASSPEIIATLNVSEVIEIQSEVEEEIIQVGDQSKENTTAVPEYEIRDSSTPKRRNSQSSESPKPLKHFKQSTGLLSDSDTCLDWTDEDIALDHASDISHMLTDGSMIVLDMVWESDTEVTADKNLTGDALAEEQNEMLKQDIALDETVSSEIQSEIIKADGEQLSLITVDNTVDETVIQYETRTLQEQQESEIEHHCEIKVDVHSSEISVVEVDNTTTQEVFPGEQHSLVTIEDLSVEESAADLSCITQQEDEGLVGVITKDEVGTPLGEQLEENNVVSSAIASLDDINSEDTGFVSSSARICDNELEKDLEKSNENYVDDSDLKLTSDIHKKNKITQKDVKSDDDNCTLVSSTACKKISHVSSSLDGDSQDDKTEKETHFRTTDTSERMGSALVGCAVGELNMTNYEDKIVDGTDMESQQIQVLQEDTGCQNSSADSMNNNSDCNATRTVLMLTDSVNTLEEESPLDNIPLKIATQGVTCYDKSDQEEGKGVCGSPEVSTELELDLDLQSTAEQFEDGNSKLVGVISSGLDLVPAASDSVEGELVCQTWSECEVQLSSPTEPSSTQLASFKDVTGENSTLQEDVIEKDEDAEKMKTDRVSVTVLQTRSDRSVVLEKSSCSIEIKTQPKAIHELSDSMKKRLNPRETADKERDSILVLKDGSQVSELSTASTENLKLESRSDLYQTSTIPVSVDREDWTDTRVSILPIQSILDVNNRSYSRYATASSLESSEKDHISGEGIELRNADADIQQVVENTSTCHYYPPQGPEQMRNVESHHEHDRHMTTSQHQFYSAYSGYNAQPYTSASSWTAAYSSPYRPSSWYWNQNPASSSQGNNFNYNVPSHIWSPQSLPQRNLFAWYGQRGYSVQPNISAWSSNSLSQMYSPQVPSSSSSQGSQNSYFQNFNQRLVNPGSAGYSDSYVSPSVHYSSTGGHVTAPSPNLGGHLPIPGQQSSQLGSSTGQSGTSNFSNQYSTYWVTYQQQSISRSFQSCFSSGHGEQRSSVHQSEESVPSVNEKDSALNSPADRVELLKQQEHSIEERLEKSDTGESRPHSDLHNDCQLDEGLELVHLVKNKSDSISAGKLIDRTSDSTVDIPLPVDLGSVTFRSDTILGSGASTSAAAIQEHLCSSISDMTQPFQQQKGNEMVSYAEMEPNVGTLDMDKQEGMKAELKVLTDEVHCLPTEFPSSDSDDTESNNFTVLKPISRKSDDLSVPGPSKMGLQPKDKAEVKKVLECISLVAPSKKDGIIENRQFKKQRRKQSNISDSASSSSVHSKKGKASKLTKVQLNFALQNFCEELGKFFIHDDLQVAGQKTNSGPRNDTENKCVQSSEASTGSVLSNSTGVEELVSLPTKEDCLPATEKEQLCHHESTSSNIKLDTGGQTWHEGSAEDKQVLCRHSSANVPEGETRLPVCQCVSVCTKILTSENGSTNFVDEQLSVSSEMARFSQITSPTDEEPSHLVELAARGEKTESLFSDRVSEQDETEEVTQRGIRNDRSSYLNQEVCKFYSELQQLTAETETAANTEMDVLCEKLVEDWKKAQKKKQMDDLMPHGRSEIQRDFPVHTAKQITEEFMNESHDVLCSVSDSKPLHTTIKTVDETKQDASLQMVPEYVATGSSFLDSCIVTNILKDSEQTETFVNEACEAKDERDQTVMSHENLSKKEEKNCTDRILNGNVVSEGKGTIQNPETSKSIAKPEGTVLMAENKITEHLLGELNQKPVAASVHQVVTAVTVDKQISDISVSEQHEGRDVDLDKEIAMFYTELGEMEDISEKCENSSVMEEQKSACVDMKLIQAVDIEMEPLSVDEPDAVRKEYKTPFDRLLEVWKKVQNAGLACKPEVMDQDMSGPSAEMKKDQYASVLASNEEKDMETEHGVECSNTTTTQKLPENETSDYAKQRMLQCNSLSILQDNYRESDMATKPSQDALSALKDYNSPSSCGSEKNSPASEDTVIVYQFSADDDMSLFDAELDCDRSSHMACTGKRQEVKEHRSKSNQSSVYSNEENTPGSQPAVSQIPDSRNEQREVNTSVQEYQRSDHFSIQHCSTSETEGGSTPSAGYCLYEETERGRNSLQRKTSAAWNFSKCCRRIGYQGDLAEDNSTSERLIEGIGQVTQLKCETVYVHKSLLKDFSKKVACDPEAPKDIGLDEDLRSEHTDTLQSDDSYHSRTVTVTKRAVANDVSRIVKSVHRSTTAPTGIYEDNQSDTIVQIEPRPITRLVTIANRDTDVHEPKPKRMRSASDSIPHSNTQCDDFTAVRMSHSTSGNKSKHPCHVTKKSKFVESICQSRSRSPNYGSEFPCYTSRNRSRTPDYKTSRSRNIYITSRNRSSSTDGSSRSRSKSSYTSRSRSRSVDYTSTDRSRATIISRHRSSLLDYTSRSRSRSYTSRSRSKSVDYISRSRSRNTGRSRSRDGTSRSRSRLYYTSSTLDYFRRSRSVSSDCTFRSRSRNLGISRGGSQTTTDLTSESRSRTPDYTSRGRIRAVHCTARNTSEAPSYTLRSTKPNYTSRSRSSTRRTSVSRSRTPDPQSRHRSSSTSSTSRSRSSENRYGHFNRSTSSRHRHQSWSSHYSTSRSRSLSEDISRYGRAKRKSRTPSVIRSRNRQRRYASSSSRSRSRDSITSKRSRKKNYYRSSLRSTSSDDSRSSESAKTICSRSPSRSVNREMIGRKKPRPWSYHRRDHRIYRGRGRLKFQGKLQEGNSKKGTTGTLKTRVDISQIKHHQSSHDRDHQKKSFQDVSISGRRSTKMPLLMSSESSTKKGDGTLNSKVKTRETLSGTYKGHNPCSTDSRDNSQYLSEESQPWTRGRKRTCPFGRQKTSYSGDKSETESICLLESMKSRKEKRNCGLPQSSRDSKSSLQSPRPDGCLRSGEISSNLKNSSSSSPDSSSDKTFSSYAARSSSKSHCPANIDLKNGGQRRLRVLFLQPLVLVTWTTAKFERLLRQMDLHSSPASPWKVRIPESHMEILKLERKYVTDVQTIEECLNYYCHYGLVEFLPESDRVCSLEQRALDMLLNERVWKCYILSEDLSCDSSSETDIITCDLEKFLATHLSSQL